MKQFGGNALSAEVFPPAAQDFLVDGEDDMAGVDSNIWTRNDLSSLEAGQMGGIIVDSAGAVVPGAEVTVTTQTSSFTTSSDSEGRWIIAGLPPGPIKIKIARTGFKDTQQELDYNASRPLRIGTTLEVGTVSETVTITSDVGGLVLRWTANRRDGEEEPKRRGERAIAERFQPATSRCGNLAGAYRGTAQR